MTTINLGTFARDFDGIVESDEPRILGCQLWTVSTGLAEYPGHECITRVWAETASVARGIAEALVEARHGETHASWVTGSDGRYVPTPYVF